MTLDELAELGLGRCTGHCCEAFSLGGTVEHVRNYPGWKDDPERTQVLNMLVDLEDWERPPHLVTSEVVPPGTPPGKFLTCKNYCDGGCAIYETRPTMCRSYPNREPCIFLFCTMVLDTKILVEHAWRNHSGQRYGRDLPEWTARLIYTDEEFKAWEESKEAFKAIEDLVLEKELVKQD